MIKKLMIVMALVIMPVCMQAQQVKFGKVNKLEIFNMMPEKAIAEKQLQEGTASSQVITHYLKLGSTKERLEKEKLREENKLLRARTEALQSAKKQEELFEEAIKAMRRYSGGGDPDEY